MKNRQYQGVQLSKKESELVQFLQTGSHEWWKAYYIYPHRRKAKRQKAHMKKEMAWFNRTLKKLHAKDLCTHIPFILDPRLWRNPGIKGRKQEFKALTLEESRTEFIEQQKQIIKS